MIKRAPKCPICERLATDPFRPFCSKRCQDVDLGRWLTGTYAIPVREEEDEDKPPVPAGSKPETEH